MNRLGSPLIYRDPVTGETRTFTEEDAKRVTEIITRDPTKEDAYIRAWRSAAESRYRAILSELQRLG